MNAFVIAGSEPSARAAKYGLGPWRPSFLKYVQRIEIVVVGLFGVLRLIGLERIVRTRTGDKTLGVELEIRFPFTLPGGVPVPNGSLGSVNVTSTATPRALGQAWACGYRADRTTHSANSASSSDSTCSGAAARMVFSRFVVE